MVSSSAQAFMSLAGWTVIPDLATQQVLRIVHRVFTNYLHLPIPIPGSPAYRKHYGYTFAFVVLGYLFYNMIQSASSMPPNFYQILGVDPTVDETGLKLAFRQFAKRYHPDRPEVGPGGEALFIAIRDAYEALKDPVVRFAYDRFGPDVLAWSNCTTTREYIQRGLMQSSGYHIAMLIGLIFWSAVGQSNLVSFWRHTLYAALFAAELALIILPSPSLSSRLVQFTSSYADPTVLPTHATILHTIFPHRVAYQHILFLHQLFIFLNAALSRVAPQLFPDDTKIQPGTLEMLQALVEAADREASVMLHADLHSIHDPPSPTTITADPSARPSLARMRPLTSPSPEVMGSLAKEMENMIIEANLKKDVGPLRSAWERAVARGRLGMQQDGDGNAGNGGVNVWEKGGDSETVREAGTPSSGRFSGMRPGLEKRESSYARGRSVSF